MKIKRILTALIGLPIVILILIFSNKYIIDGVITVVALISMYEYFKAIKSDGKTKPVKWIGYISCLFIAFIHIIPIALIIKIVGIFITLILAILFMTVVFSEMKTTVNDVALTFWGIMYIVLFISFIPLLYGLDNGKLLIWYIFISAWGTDTFAYLVGMKFGKHKFSKISPKKSIEGCIGGIIGSTILMVIYTILINRFAGLNIPLWHTLIMGAILSICSQIGDFSASSIKRTSNVKDFGNLFPGHGGMLDRIDSIIFVAPFAYFLLTLI